MTDPNPHLNSLDFAALRYPSDRITMGDIRRVHAADFDGDTAYGAFGQLDGHHEFTLPAILYAERLLAQAAFDQASGRPADALRAAGLERAGCIETLAEQYETYGAAQGQQHTEQLIRDLESQAAAQAGRRR